MLLTNGGRPRYYLRKIMIALASAGAICVRTLLGPCALIGVPLVFRDFVLLDFTGSAINSITIKNMTRFGIAAAFGAVDLPQNEFKISVPCLFGAERDTIPGDSFFIDMISLQRALE